jgi:hypothetical protein
MSVFLAFEDTDLVARTGSEKGPGKNLKKKAPAKKCKAPTPSSSSPLINKKQKKASENHESSDITRKTYLVYKQMRTGFF